jgi:chemotaxis protein methyltransferase CheR
MSAPGRFLDDQAYVVFKEYIFELTGIQYSEAKRQLLDIRIQNRASQVGLADPAAYLDYLKHNPNSKKEVGELIDQVSIHETSFFRHQQQIDIFQQLAAGLIEARRGQPDQSLRIWSAACSSGEEPYTLAMVIRRLLGNAKGWKISITGTDISSGTIEKAREAQYSARSVRSLPEEYAKYVLPDPADPHQIALDPQVARMVKFEVHSLLDQQQRWKDMDIVFCRNVLIYFDGPTKQKVSANLWSALRPGGHLVLGPSDSLLGLHTEFQRTPHSAYNFYQRPGQLAASAPVAPAAGPARKAASSPKAAVPAAEPALQTRNFAQNLRAKRYILRLDSGLRDIDQDLQVTLTRAIECLDELSAGNDQLSKAQELSRQTRTAVAEASRHLMRLLTMLQVGDRSYQRIEALRVLLQEFSDHLFEGDASAPDLRVKTQVYDENMIPKDEETEAKGKGEEAMSQEDIDALFG